MPNNYIQNMYGSRALNQNSSQPEREKRAVKVLGGIKISNGHIKRIEVAGDIIDVPKIEYVSLLEGQIREVRNHLRQAESKIIRLQANQSKLISEIRGIRLELNNKINLR